jgi:hypothetical protein
MRKMLATALLALAVTGSTFAPVGSVAFASMEAEVDQFIVDSQGLSNIEYTQDSVQPSADPPPPAPAEDRCICVVVPEEAPAA